MPTYARLTKHFTITVRPRLSETLDLPPVTPGLVKVTVFTAERMVPRLQPDDTDQTLPRPPKSAEVSLLRAGAIVITGLGTLQAQVTQAGSNYHVRVKNEATRELTFLVTVEYPSEPKILEKRIPPQFFGKKFDEFLNERREPPIKLRVHGNNATFEKSLAELHDLDPIKKVALTAQHIRRIAGTGPSDWREQPAG